MAMKAMQEKEMEESSSLDGGGLSREEGSMTSLDNYNATSTCPSVNGTASSSSSSSSVTSGISGTKRGIDQSWTQISDNTGTYATASPTEWGMMIGLQDGLHPILNHNLDSSNNKLMQYQVPAVVWVGKV